MEYLLALAAAVLLGTGFVLQQRAAEQAPKAQFLRLRLLTGLLRQPWWLAGAAAMAAGEAGAAWVLGHLELSIAEPLLTSNLLFALVLAGPLARQRATRTELAGAVLLSGGVAALTLGQAPKSASVSFGTFAHWPAAALVGLIAYGLVLAGHRWQGEQRALCTGLAAGLMLGISDALTRSTVRLLTGQPLLHLFTTWPAYCLIAVGATGFFLMQSAFNAGPLHASLPGIAAAEPVSGMLLGIVVFGDPVFVSPGMLGLRTGGILALIAGVVLVARSPSLAGLRRTQARPVPAVPRPRGPSGRQRLPREITGPETAPEPPVP